MPPDNARFQVEVGETTRLFYFFSLFGARTFAAQQNTRTAIYDLGLERYVHSAPDAEEALSIVRRANELARVLDPVTALRSATSEWLRIPPLCRS